MILLLGLVLFVVVGSLILLLPTIWRHEIYERYSGSRPVICPENRQPVAVRIDAAGAASSGLSGRSILRLSDCTRWPERSKCDQACLSEAVHVEPYTKGEVKVEKKRIYHLPILLAAFAAWCLGALWHSQYLFRARWMNALGLTPAQVKQMLWWYSPHLLTVAICLIALRQRKGVGSGVLMSLMLYAALVLSSWYGIAGLPHELLLIEAGYTVLATLIVGAIVGGLYDRLVLSSR
jgi:hypothetical protein